jgi:hypothetical protein
VDEKEENGGLHSEYKLFSSKQQRIYDFHERAIKNPVPEAIWYRAII